MIVALQNCCTTDCCTLGLLHFRIVALWEFGSFRMCQFWNIAFLKSNCPSFLHTEILNFTVRILVPKKTKIMTWNWWLQIYGILCFTYEMFSRHNMVIPRFYIQPCLCHTHSTFTTGIKQEWRNKSLGCVIWYASIDQF